MILSIIKILISIIVAFFTGKLVSKFKLPSILSICMIVVILNLGAPLDYHLIMGAGIFTAIYITARTCGKYVGARFGASITNSPVNCA